MAYLYGSGHETVDRMANFAITGNVVPQTWYRTILRETGKPHLLAIMILSDIVYWYRPKEVRDEVTGHIRGYEKRFAGDFVQKSYEKYAELYGQDRKSIKRAFDLLVDLGVVKRFFRTIKTDSAPLTNVMFLDLDVKKLHELTYPEKKSAVDNLSTKETVKEENGNQVDKSYPQVDNADIVKAAENKAFPDVTEDDTPLVTDLSGGGDKKGTTSPSKSTPLPYDLSGGGDRKGYTYTKSTTENTTKSTTEIIPIPHPDINAPARAKPDKRLADQLEREYQNRIHFETLLSEFTFAGNALKKAIREISETMTLDLPKDAFFMVNNHSYPYSLVRLRFSQATEHTFRTALSKLRVGIDCKRDMIAALYSAPLHYPSK